MRTLRKMAFAALAMLTAAFSAANSTVKNAGLTPDVNTPTFHYKSNRGPVPFYFHLRYKRNRKGQIVAFS